MCKFPSNISLHQFLPPIPHFRIREWSSLHAFVVNVLPTVCAIPTIALLLIVLVFCCASYVPLLPSLPLLPCSRFPPLPFPLPFPWSRSSDASHLPSDETCGSSACSDLNTSARQFLFVNALRSRLLWLFLFCELHFLALLLFCASSFPPRFSCPPDSTLGLRPMNPRAVARNLCTVLSISTSLPSTCAQRTPDTLRFPQSFGSRSLSHS